jgi:hypothetical protein
MSESGQVQTSAEHWAISQDYVRNPVQRWSLEGAFTVAGLLDCVIDHNRGFKIVEFWLATKNLSHPRAPFAIMASLCRFDTFPKIDAASTSIVGIVKKALVNQIGIGAPCRYALFV